MVNLLPQLHATWMSEYSGCISGFMSESSHITAREHTSLADSKQDVTAAFVKEAVAG